MKLSALIADLQSLLQTHGDMETVWFGPGEWLADPDVSVMYLHPVAKTGYAITAGEPIATTPEGSSMLSQRAGFRVELDIPTHVPPPAHFVFGKILTADGKYIGRFSTVEDTARMLAERIDGVHRPEREWGEDPDEWRDIAANQD